MVYDVTPPDVTFDLEIPEEVKIGKDFTVIVTCRSQSIIKRVGKQYFERI